MQTLKEFRLKQYLTAHDRYTYDPSEIAFTIDYCMNTRSLYEGLCELARHIALPSRSIVHCRKSWTIALRVLKEASSLWQKEEKIEGTDDRIRWDNQMAIPTLFKFIIDNPDRFGVTI